MRWATLGPRLALALALIISWGWMAGAAAPVWAAAAMPSATVAAAPALTPTSAPTATPESASPTVATPPAGTPAPDAVPAPPAKVTRLGLVRETQGLSVFAHMQFDLPKAAKEVLLKGVSLYFMADLSVIRQRWYWRDEVLLSQQLYWRLTYLPVSRRWQLQRATEPWSKPGGLIAEQLFDDLESALKAMQTLERWSLTHSRFMSTPQEKTLTFTFELEQLLLPRPLALNPLGKDIWKLRISREINLIPSGEGR